MEVLAEAFQRLTPSSFLFLLIGMVMGMVLGAIPGLTATMGIVLILPFTYSMEPVAAILMLAGAYKGSYTGGGISSILIGTPGTAAAVATTFDGYAMAKNGQAGKALSMTRIASVIGDSIGFIVLLVAIAPLAKLALLFGSPEYAAMVVFSLVLVASVSAVDGSFIKSLIALAFGVLVATVGLDPISGSQRFLFGHLELMDGLDMRAVLIGLFALAEVFYQVTRQTREQARQVFQASTGNPEDDRVSWAEFRRCFPTIIRSSIIGTLIGAFPGISSSIASYVGYGAAKRASKTPEKFGKGCLEGVAAAESADSACLGADLIPLLSLGLPGDVTAAILSTAFIIHGLIPGPNLLQERGDIVYAIILGLLFGNILLFAVSIPLMKYIARLIQVRSTLLFPLVLVFAVLGVYAESKSVFALNVAFVFGVLGFLMKWFGFSRASFVLGFVLGPLLEVHTRRSLVLSGGSPVIFLTHPLALAMVVGTAFLIAKGLFQAFRQRTRNVQHEGAVLQ